MKALKTHAGNLINVAVVESDPLRLAGFRAILETEANLQLVPADLSALNDVDVVVLGNRDYSVYDLIASMRTVRPDLCIIVTGGDDEESVIKALAAGAKGYVNEAASPDEFIQAIRSVHQGSVWAARHALSVFIDRASTGRLGIPNGRIPFTAREQQVLEMLVGGYSNKEIGLPLGIGERTVKAHVAKLMRKAGVHNRIELSVQAVARSLVRTKQSIA